RILSVPAVCVVSDRKPRSAAVLRRSHALRHRHQCGNVAPQVIGAVVPSSSPDPLLRALDVLDDHWDVAPGGIDRLTLDSEARLEQTIVGRWQGLRTLPRHRPIAVLLARRARDDQMRIAELSTVDREHVLQHELRWIAVIAVDMLLDVEADDAPALGEQAVCP